MKTIVFYDIETGGLDKATSPITWIAGTACDARTLRVTNRFSQRVLFKNCDVSHEALDTQGYDPKLWSETGLPLRPALVKWVEFLGKHACVPVPKKSGEGHWMAAQPAGYNNCGFDTHFLRRDLANPDWQEGRTGKGIFSVGRWQEIDIYQRVLWLAIQGQFLHDEPTGLGVLPNLKLATVWEHLHDGPMVDAHNPLVDCRATIDIAAKVGWASSLAQREMVLGENAPP